MDVATARLWQEPEHMLKTPDGNAVEPAEFEAMLAALKAKKPEPEATAEIWTAEELAKKGYLSELERGQTCTRFALDGEWFVDGFAGAMGELLCAVDENREPSNSASDNVATLRITLAARDSARRGGAQVDLHGLAL